MDQFILQRRTLATEEASSGPSAQPQDDTSANIVRDSPSLVDTKTRAESDKTNSGVEKTTEMDQDQAGSDPGESLKSQPQPEQVHMDKDQAGPDPGISCVALAGPDPGISCVALAGPDPKPTHDEFMADLYPKVQESLKFSTDEHVILEDPLSSTGTLSSMKNLEDANTIGDQFINDKSTDDEPGKLNAEAEVVSMFTVPIYQASSSVPPLSTPVIDLSPPKPTSSTTQTPISINLRSRVYTLEFRDLPHKIDEAVCENVKEAVQIALQAPFRDRFRDLSKEDMKEMLHQRMLETGSYKSLPEHIALYEALKVSMKRAQRDEFLAEKDKLRKRHRDDQDPPPHPPDPDLSKRRRHDTGASGSSQPQAPQSSAWKKSDTRDAPSSSSKQQSGPHAEQPVEDIPIPDSANISDSEDTDSAHILKIKQRLEWLKPIPDDERPSTPEPAWVIPTSHVPDAMNNWDNALATTKGSGQALSISKMKAARYHDFGLELLIPEHMWIDDPTLAGYDYLKEITLRRAHHQEYTIAEKDFKNLYPSDFEDLNLLLLQGHLNHLPGSDICFEFKHEYTIIDSPYEVVFLVSNNERKIMRFNEIYKFSDGTLTNIMEALDYRVKEYKVNLLNPGMNTQFWTDKDVERSKEFIHAIERRLKTRRKF
ncbi:hypothetical protein Tco_0482007 [Tanacetum coccineum]